MKSIFIEQVIKLLKLVDFDKSEIRRDNRTVFLCGGQLSPSVAVPPSVREALLRHLPSRDQFNGAQIILAERATEALPGTKFSNLLDLEEYISALVDGVILIVESSGSICELGAFVKTPEISSKLIILISSTQDNTASFIKLGALNYFDEASGGDSEICPFHWEVVSGGISIQDYVLTDIVSEMSDSLKKVKSKGNFSLNSLGDRIYLTLAICHLLRGAKSVEITECYKQMGLNNFVKEITKHLSVLEICKYITPVSHGKKIKYFIPLVDTIPIKFAFMSQIPDRDRNVLRWISRISALISENDPIRMRIFHEHQNVK